MQFPVNHERRGSANANRPTQLHVRSHALEWLFLSHTRFESLELAQRRAVRKTMSTARSRCSSGRHEAKRHVAWPCPLGTPGRQCLRRLSAQVQKYLVYDRYLAAGMPIVTGVIVGACRNLVKDRLDY